MRHRPVDAVAKALEEVLVITVGVGSQERVDEALALEGGDLPDVDHLAVAVRCPKDRGVEAGGGRESLQRRPLYRLFVVVVAVCVRATRRGGGEEFGVCEELCEILWARSCG